MRILIGKEAREAQHRCRRSRGRTRRAGGAGEDERDADGAEASLKTAR